MQLEIELKARLKALEEWRINNNRTEQDQEYLVKKFSILAALGIVPWDGTN